jgi:hypothetical protein
MYNLSGPIRKNLLQRVAPDAKADPTGGKQVAIHAGHDYRGVALATEQEALVVNVNIESDLEVTQVEACRSYGIA